MAKQDQKPTPDAAPNAESKSGRPSNRELSPDDLVKVSGGITISKPIDVASSGLMREVVNSSDTKVKIS